MRRVPILGSLWLVGAAAALVLAAGSSSTPAHHTLHYFFTGVSEPSHGLPQFTIVGYLDDQQFVQYDSDARRDMPRSPWIRKVELEDPQYWDWQTQLSHSWELYFRVSLWGRSNHSQGFHTWQWMHGCELGQDGHIGGLSQFGYDGKDFLSLDKETLTWTAADSRAQVTKRRWEADPVWTEGRKNFLEGDCIEWLHKYLSYGKETLLRTESPVVTVTRKVNYGGLETLTCRAYGFYPKQIDATWRKDREVLETETYHGGVSPNIDGTYYTWLSIEVNPEKRGLYQCHVEHDSLSEPLDVAWKPSDSTGFLVGCISGGLATLVLLMVVFIFCIRKQQEGYQSAPTDAHLSL